MLNLWKTETIGIQSDEQKDAGSKLTLDEKRAKEHFEKTTLYDGRSFTCDLPFQCDPKDFLKDNFGQAKQRFLTLEKKWEKQPQGKLECKNTFEKYLTNGFIRECTQEELNLPASSRYYLNYHLVKKKGDDKWRVVFDGACKYMGTSLNDLLLAGPKLQTDLINVLFRFRRYKYVVTADIKSMFSNIKLSDKHSQFCRFLYRDNPDEVIRVYMFLRVIFGLKSSPFQAIACLLYLADKYEKEFPQAASEIKDSTYVDDWISSFFAEDRAARVSLELIELLQRGGFLLVKFNSNSTTVLTTIPKELQSSDVIDFTAIPTAGKFPEEEKNETKTLGLVYEFDKDMLSFDFREKLVQWSDEKKWTRRKTLSCVASIFDPMGLVAPYINGLKILNQETWKEDLDWDDPLPEDLMSRWQQEFDKVMRLDKVYFQRHLNLDRMLQPACKLEFLVCCDASEKIYSTVIYCRTILGDDVDSRLILCKSRLAPLNKQLTIPRLELLACLIGVRAMTDLLTQLKLPEEWRKRTSIKYFTDSGICVCWINQKKTKYLVYVENRCREINEKSNKEDWSHLISAENAADIPTRQESPWKIADFHKIWERGLAWIRNGADPVKGDVNPAKLKADIDNEYIQAGRKEHEAITLITSTQQPNATLHKLISSVCAEQAKWGRSLKKIRLVYEFIKKKVPNWMKNDTLTEKECEIILLRLLQEEEYFVEIQLLKKGKQISATSSLAKLAPYLDDNGLLRADSRVTEFEDEKPIILGRGDGFKHLICQAHYTLFHAKTERVLHYLQDKFWVMGGRHQIKHVLKMCAVCRVRERKALEPHMGRLPAFRTSFRGHWNIAVGIDFCGPFYVQRNSSKERKVYVLIFVDAAIRLLTLIPTLDLTTESVILGIEDFCATRGTPQTIISDNGLSLVSAAKTLRDIYSKINWKEVQHHFSAPNQTIEWKFIPAFSPWYGGMWERFNATFKNALNYTFNIDMKKLRKDKENLHFEEFCLALKKVAAVINDRPLTFVSSGEDFEHPLSPALLAFGQRMTPLPFLNRKPIDSVQENYKRRSLMIRHFTSIWKSKYLASLTPYSAWAKKQRSVRVGDVVQICDKNSSKGWRLGIITGCSETNHLNPVSVRVQTYNSKAKKKEEEVISVRRLKLAEANEEPDDGPTSTFRPTPLPPLGGPRPRTKLHPTTPVPPPLQPLRSGQPRQVPVDVPQERAAATDAPRTRLQAALAAKKASM